MIGVVLFVKGQNGTIRLLKNQLAPVFRRTLSDRLALNVPLIIGLVQREGCAVDCFAVLVDLLDLGRRQGGEVELELHVRCARAALQIEETQLVLGAAAEGVAGKVGGGTGSLELRLDVGRFEDLLGSICTINMTDFHFAGSKVDLKRCLLVNATQVTHEHAVDVDPHVIVARELKDHVLVLVGLAVCGLDKLRGHGHAKVMVEIRASINDLFRGEVVAVLIKNLACRVKGEELAQIGFATRIALIYARFIVDVKGISREVIHSVVAVRAVRVVDVIAILELEETLHVVVDGFAVLAVIVKEIGQRLIGVVSALALGGVGASLDLRIALYKLVLNKLKATVASSTDFARPLVNARAGTTIELELMVFIDAGVVILVVVVYIGGIVVIAIHDPVVKQIDRGAGRIHRLYGMVAHGSRCTRRTKQERTRRQRDGQNL